MTESTSEFLHKEACPKCGSRDNLARYTDGHGHCFGCGHYEHGEGAITGSPRQRDHMSDEFVQGAVSPLSARRITQETCAHFNYQTGVSASGKPVQIANYYTPEGEHVAQKLRYADKTFKVVGSLKEAGLYGQHLWRDGGKKVVITEGEIDALTVSQLQANKWPVVSIANGAQSAKKALAAQLPWLLKFEEVVLMFDDDEPGRAAAAECAPLFPAGRCKIARIAGHKDANEALQAGQGGKVIEAMWGAKEYRPDGILTMADIVDDVLKPIEIGLPWFDERLTALTNGRRLGELHGFGAGTGVGKTDLFTQQMAFDVLELKEKIGVFSLEQAPQETAKRLAGKIAKRRFHIPNGGWSQDELVDTARSMEQSGRLFFYDTRGANFGTTAWDTIKGHMRFLAHHEGIRLFYLDHLTALAAAEEDERIALERITAEMGGLVKELNIVLHFISHLATPDGTPHEEGGRVMIRHFKGSRAIGFWSHFMYGLERNQQSDEPAIRGTTTLRCLKDRDTGNSTGECVYFGYDRDTGLLVPCDAPPKPSEAKKHGFTDTTSQDF